MLFFKIILYLKNSATMIGSFRNSQFVECCPYKKEITKNLFTNMGLTQNNKTNIHTLLITIKIQFAATKNDLIHKQSLQSLSFNYKNMLQKTHRNTALFFIFLKKVLFWVNTRLGLGVQYGNYNIIKFILEVQ